jgi:AraC-like DNA-binding protein
LRTRTYATYDIGMVMAPSRSPAQGHTVPVTLVTELVELVARWGVRAGELLGGAAIDPEVLEDPLGRLDCDTMNALLDRARTLTGEPGLGYCLGLQKRASIYGYLGFAAKSAPSLREALNIAVQFAPVHSTAIGIELCEEGGFVSLCFEERMELGTTRDIVLISLMFGFLAMGRALSGQNGSLSGATADFAFPQPAYHARFAHLVPEVRFDQPRNRVIFDAAALDVPVVTADRAALHLAKALCERALDEIDLDAGLGDRVRAQLWTDSGGFRSLQQVAERLGVSPRTLKRRLAAQDLSFSELVERERCERALILLRSRLSIDEVAERLEYSGAATFVRAFHRWTGTTPGVYRRAGRVAAR